MFKLARAALPDGRSCGALDPVKLALLAVPDESLFENGELPANRDVQSFRRINADTCHFQWILNVG